MRFVVVTAAFALLVGAALSGCAAKVPGNPVAEPTVAAADPAHGPGAVAGGFTDPTGRFGLVPPAGWVVDTSGASSTAALFLDPRPTPTDAGNFTANINVLIVPKAGALPDVVADAQREMSSLASYRALEDEPFPLADGHPGYLIGGRFDDPAGYPLRNIQLFSVQDDRTVVVTGTALAPAWEEFGPVFDAVLRTVSVGATSPAPGTGLAE
ncbi:MAG TPA: hypothetical protein VNA11_01000 [Pseudonocardia sp.]|nr:hypothetical protein [Pseudonocardia sp.]